jgi:KaiC/GvpD/RAD55 family RecA-like ATPase
MANETDGLAQQIVAANGSYEGAVHLLLTLERSLWKFALFENSQPSLRQHSGQYRKVNIEHFLESLPESAREPVRQVIPALEATNLFLDYRKGVFGYDLDIFRPFKLVRSILGSLKPDHEARYFVLRNIRKVYRCQQTASTAHFFYLLSGAVNNMRQAEGSDPQRGRKHIWNYESEFKPSLMLLLAKEGWPEPEAEHKVNLFIESCRAVGYLRAHYSIGAIDLRTTSIDAAFLLSNLFGMPTAIRGFDELFGGGGIMFHERLSEEHSARGEELTSQDESIGGRTLMILGRFGTGKSLLSLQLAVEVARKGGLAWVVPLEQSAEECLYTLESIRALPADGSVIIANDTVTATEILQNRQVGRGALLFLKSSKDSYGDFLASFTKNVELMKAYPFRVVCVDPINSISRRATSVADLRASSLEMISQIESTGTNVVLVAEEGAGAEEDLTFEQNIADIVIRLSVDKSHGYAARFIEIMKSRLQREQRGVHPFSILPGSGLTIYPSSASVSARIRPRGVRESRGPVPFGLPTIDSILGESAIAGGDVVVLQGPGGSYKTPLGLIFLLGSDWETKDKTKSLIVAARDDESTILHLLDQNYVRSHHNNKKTIKDILICTLPHGHIYPGYVIQRIEDEFVRARLGNYQIDRVMTDDISHWEMSSPFIREDETFGATLVDFLRRHGVTSLFTCNDFSPNAPSAVQRPVIDMANCLIKLDQVEYRGLNHVIVRVQKTRGMHHRGEAFEVSLVKEGFLVEPSSSLLREIPGGETSPIKIRLFLRSTSDIQKEYNNRLLKVIKAVLTRDSKIEPQDRIYTNKAVGLISSSVLDELHVLQLDEYQLPSKDELAGNRGSLHRFESRQWPAEWDDFIPATRERGWHGDSFFAVPYFENVSLLAYRSDLIAPEDTKTWARLAELSEQWETDRGGDGACFFDFPQTEENINCLFMEILLALDTVIEETGDCGLLKVLCGPQAVEAANILHRLGSRSFQSRRSPGGVSPDDVGPKSEGALDTQSVHPGAAVWRLWYSTLYHLLSKPPRKDLQHIRVCELPGGVATAGEWYLGIPVYSAAPDVGLEIIKLLTSREAEVNRLQLGVGLPIRDSYYEKLSPDTSASFVPAARVSNRLLKNQIDRAFRRSRCGSYSQIATILSYHLLKILELAGEDKEEVKNNIRLIFESFESNLRFVRKAWDCTNCRLLNS